MLGSGVKGAPGVCWPGTIPPGTDFFFCARFLAAFGDRMRKLGWLTILSWCRGWGGGWVRVEVR